MFKHYLKVALRNLRRHGAYSLLNIVGLAIGIASCILCLLFVQEELSYDRYHVNAERIYRVTVDLTTAGQPLRPFAIASPPMGPAIAENFPEVLSAVRLRPYFEGGLPGPVSVSRGENRFYESFYWVDPSVFEIFTIPLLAGDPDTALVEPYSLVISERTARKYFGSIDVVGELMKLDTGFSEADYKVTGVMENIPENSHLHFDIMASFSSLDSETDVRNNLTNWFSFDMYTYLLLPKGYPAAELEAKFPGYIEDLGGEKARKLLTWRLQPLTDIHLRSHLLSEAETNSDVTYLYIFSVIALFTLLTACINFINLATARAGDRAREVGMRKVVGAHRSQLIRQFLGESVLLTLLSLVVALALARLALPVLNELTDKALSIATLASPTAVLVLFAVLLAVGVLAGIYPAFFLASFRPVDVIKGGVFSAGTRGAFFRRALVVLQFTISIVLIVATAIVSGQLSYMKEQKLGFDMEDVVVIPVRDTSLRDRYALVRQELSRDPAIRQAALSAIVLGKQPPNISLRVEGLDDFLSIDTIVIDEKFIDTFGLQVVAGRGFSAEVASDPRDAFMINETAVAAFGWKEPEEALGKEVIWAGLKTGRIIGVVKDFHYRPLRFPIQPLVLHVRPLVFHYVFARIDATDVTGSLAVLESQWRRVMPDRPFEYFFLDDEFARMYRVEDSLGKAFGYFALIAIVVACLGLLGLAAYTAQKRTKEIGIRKVLGASPPSIVVLLSTEVTWLVLIAAVLAIPLAYGIMSRWLEDFAFRIILTPWYFLPGALAALLIAWLTVASQAWKAAAARPVDTLRYE